MSFLIDKVQMKKVLYKWKGLLSFVCIYFAVATVVAQPQKLGKLKSSLLTEVSGITASHQQSGYFWVHNDSGDKSQIYLIDSLANLKVTAKLNGIQAVDCEDIARVVMHDTSFLLLADIGNNLKNRTDLRIYMFPEPKVDFSSQVIHIPNKDIRTISIRYIDKNRDAEAIFVDQQNLDVYIVSKRDFYSTVFSFSLQDIVSQSEIVLSPKMELPFTFTTGADMSVDGRTIVIKNLTHIYLWKRLANESVLKALSKPYQTIPYRMEPQGEAICFDSKNRFFYTISERPFGLESYLYKYNY